MVGLDLLGTWEDMPTVRAAAYRTESLRQGVSTRCYVARETHHQEISMVRTHLFMVVALAFGILSACGEVKDDSVEGTDACAEVTCGENASCVDADGDASCECDDGYAGDGQDCCSDEEGDGERRRDDFFCRGALGC